ncbi:MAG TPA: sugar phosphate isomerase/epimerase [Candidatus Omnitrophota bacterium]|nr:sugar phosphate isomerase/epimerase [Candidatus Omnitrophota bacterium]
MRSALSTSWNAFRHGQGRDLVFEIQKLGFEEVELSFNLTSSIVEEIGLYAAQGAIKISSVHNYCPIPPGLTPAQALPDCYAMSSCNEQERLQAVQFTKRSIDTAHHLGARSVVLHCGRVEIPDRTRPLIKLLECGKKDTPEFIRLRKELIEERISKAQPFFENTLKSLAALNSYAREKNVLLGVETRYYHREIPTFEEIGIILKEFDNSQIGYWHDTGHAQVTENLGIAKHKDFLDSYGKRLIGLHVHDSVGGDDHRAPGEGNLDFTLIKPYLNESITCVIEAHHPATASQIKRAQALVEEIGNG